MTRPRKKSDQLRVIDRRSDCEDYELAQALREAGHPVLGVTTRGDRWWLVFGLEESGELYDATEQEMAAATAAAKTAAPDRRPRLKRQLEPILTRLAVLSQSAATRSIYAAEIAELEAQRDALIGALAPPSLKEAL